MDNVPRFIQHIVTLGSEKASPVPLWLGGQGNPKLFKPTARWYTAGRACCLMVFGVVALRVQLKRG